MKREFVWFSLLAAGVLGMPMKARSAVPSVTGESMARAVFAESRAVLSIMKTPLADFSRIRPRARVGRIIGQTPSSYPLLHDRFFEPEVGGLPYRIEKMYDFFFVDAARPRDRLLMRADVVFIAGDPVRFPPGSIQLKVAQLVTGAYGAPLAREACPDLGVLANVAGLTVWRIRDHLLFCFVIGDRLTVRVQSVEVGN